MLKIKGLGNIDWDLDEMVPSHQEDFALNFLLKLDRKRLEWGHVTYSHGEVNYGDPGFVSPILNKMAKCLSMKYGETESMSAPGEDEHSIRIKISVSQNTTKRILGRPTSFIIALVREMNCWADK